ncbi:MAG: M20/M25/M40 family metallo-hydrolase [Chloroflexota bacterium]
MISSSELYSSVNHWVDEHTEDLWQLTEALIRFPSENRAPKGFEKEAQAFVAETMRGLNLELDIFEPTDVPELATHPILWPGRDYRDRPNVVGTWRGANPRAGQSLLFSSHVDVVAGSKGGRFSPFEPARENGKLYGRGSNDMKGGLAASITAVSCLQSLGVRLNGDVIVESVVDEEMGGSNGTLASRLRGHNADACISPEPNGMLVSPAHRGGRVWEITLEGSPGMPFGSDDLVNPAYGIAHLAVAIEAWERARNQRIAPHPMYVDAPGLPVVLTAIQAGDFEPGSGDGVPGSGRLEVWAEVYPGTTAEELEADFIGHLKRVAAETPVLQKCAMQVHEMTRFLPGSEIPSDHPIVQLVSREYAQVLRRAAVIRGAPFACDVFVFNLYSATPCVILGPRGGNAHAPDEWVLMEDLVALTKIFALTAAEWCGFSGLGF